MSTEYPYILKTKEPALQYETFNGAKFAYMLWPAQSITQQDQEQEQDQEQDQEQEQDHTKPKGRVLLVHGFGEYTKIQYRLMDHLSQNGFESFTFDQRGAGATTIGELSMMKSKGKTNEFHTFNDLEHFIDLNLKQCNGLNIPLFLWGHSMGGGIILNYSLNGKNKSNINGYIASAPLIILHPHTRPNKLTMWLSPMLASCLPNMVIDTGLDLDGITSDNNYKQFLANDKPMSIPLYGSLRQIHDFMQRGKKLYKNDNNLIQNNYDVQRPIIIFHGESDTINDPKGSKKFIQDCTSNDKLLKTYPDMKHSIFSLETDEHFEIVFNDFLTWLNDHI